MGLAPLVSGVAVWALLIALILVEVAPLRPETPLGWVLLVVAGPPVYLVGELIGGRVFSREVGTRISPRGLSLARVAVATVGLVLVSATVWWLLRSG